MWPDAGRVLVDLLGELDLVAAGLLSDLLLDLEAERPEWLVLDLRRLTFMDCHGRAVLLEADARARQTGRRLVVACVAGQVRRLLAVSGADQQLDLVADPAECWEVKATSLLRLRVPGWSTGRGVPWRSSDSLLGSTLTASGRCAAAANERCSPAAGRSRSISAQWITSTPRP